MVTVIMSESGADELLSVFQSEQELLARVTQVVVWKQGEARAPHKPLLLLWALARIQRGEERLFSYADLEEPLANLLVDFGPSRRSYHPEYPFWRLQNDGIWEIPERELLIEAISDRRRQGDVPPAILHQHRARGGFSEEIDARLRANPVLLERITHAILYAHFPASIHDDILDAVGMDWLPVDRRPRSAGFRDLILRIYEHRCAICGYDGRLGRSDLAIDAAHIRWHAHGGPDQPDNGLALCSFHHKALDRGALGIDDDRRILVSQDVHGSHMVEELLLRFSRTELRSPQSGQPLPAAAFIRWHQRHVFHRPARI